MDARLAVGCDAGVSVRPDRPPHRLSQQQPGSQTQVDHRGADVYVCTRDHERHQKLAEELGATWVGGTFETPPEKLDASIIFAPAGEIVPAALSALDRDCRLVLWGIHMSAIPEFPYRDIYWERVIRSVANNTRADGREFIAEAVEANIQTHTEIFPLAEANEALLALKQDAIKGAGVLVMDNDL